MRVAVLLGAGLLAFCLGCKRASETQWLDRETSSSQGMARSNLKQFGLAVAEAEAEERIGKPADGKGPRKLVYRAEVDLMVADLTSAEQELEELLEAHDGTIANAETVSRAGAPRTAIRHLRIPVAKFDAFIKALSDLGELHRSKLDVQDVTRSHSELEEQIRNMAAEVAGLRELLKKPTDKLADTLAVREQLSKTTREMEGLKARLVRMRAMAEYSTVTLRMLERSGYGSPGAMSLGRAASRAFWDSWEALVAVGRGAVLACVMLCPWLPLLVVAALPLWVWRRRRRAAVPA